MPDHDLVALWEAHCRYEFETRDVDATMATMVAEPYVNHVPTAILILAFWCGCRGFVGWAA